MGRGNSKSGGGGKPFTPITDAKSFGYANIYGSNEETDKFFGTPEWIDSLTPGEKSAVTWYTGSAYSSLNHNLRTGDDLSECSDYQKSQIEKMDKAIAKAELKEPITLYRGSSTDLLGGAKTVEDIQKLVGATVKDKAYVSASVSKNGSFSHQPIAYKIIVPAGKGRGAYVGNISNVKSEAEYLMKRNATYKITGVTYSKKLGKPVVTMQMID